MSILDGQMIYHLTSGSTQTIICGMEIPFSSIIEILF